MIPGPPPAAARRLSTSLQARARLRIPETRPPPVGHQCPERPQGPRYQLLRRLSLECLIPDQTSQQLGVAWLASWPRRAHCAHCGSPLRQPTHPGPGRGPRPPGLHAPAPRGRAPPCRSRRASAAGPFRTAPFSGRWLGPPWPFAPARGAGRRSRAPPRRNGIAEVAPHSSIVSRPRHGTGALSQARAARLQAGRHLLSRAATRSPRACPGPASACPASAPASLPACGPP